MLTRTPDGVDHLDYSVISVVDPIDSSQKLARSG